jgi:hypothetical protein
MGDGVSITFDFRLKPEATTSSRIHCISIIVFGSEASDFITISLRQYSNAAMAFLFFRGCGHLRGGCRQASG